MYLNVYIAKCGFCSRRKAAALIKEGKVRLNGKPVLRPNTKVDERDTVVIGGKTLSLQKNTYIIFNKPRGVTTTLKDKFASKKISDFIPKKYGRVYPVGRLDRDSRGLMVLVNDGELCYRLTHPKFEVEKEYILWIRGDVSEEEIKKAKKGVHESGDFLKVKNGRVEIKKHGKTKIRVIATEGKKRHLRRLFNSLGLEVLDLQRVRTGNLKLGNLKEGAFRIIDKTALIP